VLIVELSHAGDVLFGDDQKMHRRPWIDVVKGHHLIVFIDESGGNLALNDFAKNAVLIVVHSSGDL
jgi:hypothetical protein